MRRVDSEEFARAVVVGAAVVTMEGDWVDTASQSTVALRSLLDSVI